MSPRPPATAAPALPLSLARATPGSAGRPNAPQQETISCNAQRHELQRRLPFGDQGDGQADALAGRDLAQGADGEFAKQDQGRRDRHRRVRRRATAGRGSRRRPAPCRRSGRASRPKGSSACSRRASHPSKKSVIAATTKAATAQRSRANCVSGGSRSLSSAAPAKPKKVSSARTMRSEVRMLGRRVMARA